MKQLFKECTYNELDPKFAYLSNFTKFTVGRQSMAFDSSLKGLMEFLKYECDHQARPLIISRLTSLCISLYKKEVLEEFLNARKRN